MKLIHAKIMKLTNGYTALFSLLIFLLFVIIVLPNEAQKGEVLGLISGPDTSLFYTAEQLYDIANEYGPDGREFYIHQRYTFDLIWPVVYGSFILISSTYFHKKSNLLKKYSLLSYFSVIAVIFDYLENMMTSVVMYRYPTKTPILDNLAGYMTLLKWITLGFAFIILMILSVTYTFESINKKINRSKKTS
jgi:hypothetical protein